jgi:hypothetical protein
MGNSESITIESLEQVLSRWEKDGPRQYAKKLIDTWGPPTGIGKFFMVWEFTERKKHKSVTVYNNLDKNYVCTCIKFNSIKKIEDKLAYKRNYGLDKNYGIDYKRKLLFIYSTSIRKNNKIIKNLKN